MAQEEISVVLQAARQALTEKRTEEAIANLEATFARHADSAEVATMLGAAYAEKKEHDIALGWFEKAAAISPSARAYFNLAMLHRVRNNPNDVRTALEKALKLDPSYDKARQLLAQMPPSVAQQPAPRPAMSPLSQQPTVTMPAQPSAPAIGLAQPTVVPSMQQTVYASPPLGVQPGFAPQQFGQPQYGAAPTAPSGGMPQTKIVPTNDWPRIIGGGVIVGFSSLILFAGWSSNFYQMGLPIGAALMVGLAATALLDWWLSRIVGDIESYHWIIFFFTTGLIFGWIIVKGFELLFNGLHATKKVTR